MNLPQNSFYRYRSLSGDSLAHLRRTLCDGEIFFSSPSAFNDPFDCNPNFLFDVNKAKTKKYYEDALCRRSPHLNRQGRRVEAKRVTNDPMENFTNPENLHRFREMYDESITKKIGILCLSETPNDILMWSHYADSHRGVCLQFDTMHTFFQNTHKVIYQEDRPRINPSNQTHLQMTEYALLTKSAHWKYEKERRIIRYQPGAGICQIPAIAVTGLIFGAQTPKDEKELIRSWVVDRATPFELYESHLSNQRFSIEIKRHDFNNS
jgi:hypothetical protein